MSQECRDVDQAGGGPLAAVAAAEPSGPGLPCPDTAAEIVAPPGASTPGEFSPALAGAAVPSPMQSEGAMEPMASVVSVESVAGDGPPPAPVAEVQPPVLSQDAASRLRIDVISLVPEAFAPLQGLGVIGRALRAGIATVHLHNPRDFATDRYRKVDDLPYGGGAGMVLKPEPVFAAFASVPVRPRRRVLLMTPQGTPLHQRDLQRWAAEHDQLVLLCGHYEGFDERIRSLADEEVSLGDFVLTGGELPAMVIINGVVRLLPGTVGAVESLEQESHSDLLLEHPHYTRPPLFGGLEVPAVLRSGDHGAIARWRLEQQQQRTRERRPDLYAQWLERQREEG